MEVDRKDTFVTKSRLSSRALVVLAVSIVVAIVLAIFAASMIAADTLRGIRAFVGAEGLWSKHQKDATQALVAFERTRLPQDWEAFRHHLEFLQGVSIARTELDRADPDMGIVRRGFLELGVSLRDLPSLVRVYRRFRGFPEVSPAIDTWVRGDELIEGLLVLGDQLRQALDASAGSSETAALLSAIEATDSQLRELEDKFSAQLAVAANWAHGLLRTAMLGFSVVAVAVILGLGVLGVRLVSRAEASNASLSRKNWLTTSRAKLGEAMAGILDEQELVSSIVGYLTPRLGAQVGALYLVDDEGRLRLRASHAWSMRKELPQVIAPGEGIVGQAVLERQAIVLTKVPDDYIAVRSGLGEATPRNILVYPISDEESVRAVIELAALEEFPSRVMEVLAFVNQDIAHALAAAESRRVNQKLLLASQANELRLQEMNEELQAQQEELRQSNEALEAQQRQLEEVNTELEEKGQELERERRQIVAQNEALEEVRQDLENKARDLERASRYKSEFLANMSHELRTPLNSIIVLSGLLTANRDDNLTEKQVGFARTINESGSHLVTLINEILDLSKIEAGRLDLNLEQVALVDVIEPIERQLRPVAEGKGLEFEVTIDDNAPAALRTDGQRLAQVLRNLLSNALKFTERGGVTLTARRPLATECSRADLRVPAEGMLAVQVKDTGIGIAEEQHRQVFEAFQQADGSTGRKYGGTGLGLAISRRLARLLGGDILLDSTPGEGSCFTLIVPQTTAIESPHEPPRDGEPISAAADQPASARAAAPAPAADIATIVAPAAVVDDRTTIEPGDRVLLIIEDDVAFATTLMELGRERGFRCLVALDGESGLVLTDRYKPTAILLDLNLPGMDGMTIIARLKDDLRTRHIPVHVISGRDRLLDTLRAGAIGYLRKPVNIGQLDSAFGRIEDLLSHPVRRLLLVEADAESRDVIVDALQGADVEIRHATDGERALTMLRAERVDCVVIGDTVDDMPAVDLLERIRRSDEHSDTPVVVVTKSEHDHEELTKLHRYADRVIEGERAQARLLDETALFLHRVEADLPEEKRRVLRSLHDSRAILQGRKVLLVDDDMRNVFAVSSVLEEEEMPVVVARNGLEALTRLEEHGDVELVLMDIMMPEMDGYEAMRRIRADDRHRDLPIIALTAKAMRDDRAKCIEAGANDYLAKPVDTAMLLSMMRVWLYR